MKDPLERTKVVVRRLPPAISRSAFMEQIDGKFAGKYKWICFRPGKNTQRNQRLSRVYIDFVNPEDVVEFAEFFNGHVFVNEKGTQFKAAVEYAPSQCIPKPSKKDGREGTIFKDPEYIAFLEHLSKPTENLPSAEIQLERREAEKAGAAKEPLIVTPLMEFVRQKRASKNASHKSSVNGKSSRKVSGSSSTSKRSSEKKKQSNPVYVLRDSTKGIKEKPKMILMQRRDDAESKEALNDEIGSRLSVTGTSATVTMESGKKKLVLLKGKGRDASNASPVTSPSRSLRQSQRHGGSGRIIKSILSKEAKQAQSPPTVHNSDQPSILDKDKRPPKHPNSRNQGAQIGVHDSPGKVEVKSTIPVTSMSGEGRGAGGLRNSSQKHAGRRGPRETEGFSSFSDAKTSSKRGLAGFSSHEKQVWVQKSGSGS